MNAGMITQVLALYEDQIEPLMGAPKRIQVVQPAWAATILTASPAGGGLGTIASGAPRRSVRVAEARDLSLQQHPPALVLLGNEDIYVLFRLLHVLYRRLSTVRRCCARGGQSGDRPCGTAAPASEDQASADAAVPWSNVMDVLLQHMSRPVEEEATRLFNKACLDLLGPNSYPLFDVGRLMQRIVQRMKRTLVDHDGKRLWQMFRQQQQQSNARGFQEYKATCRKIASDRNLFQLEYHSGPARSSLEISWVSSKDLLSTSAGGGSSHYNLRSLPVHRGVSRSTLIKGSQAGQQGVVQPLEQCTKWARTPLSVLARQLPKGERITPSYSVPPAGYPIVAGSNRTGLMWQLLNDTYINVQSCIGYGKGRHKSHFEEALHDFEDQLDEQYSQIDNLKLLLKRVRAFSLGMSTLSAEERRGYTFDASDWSASHDKILQGAQRWQQFCANPEADLPHIIERLEHVLADRLVKLKTTLETGRGINIANHLRSLDHESCVSKTADKKQLKDSYPVVELTGPTLPTVVEHKFAGAAAALRPTLPQLPLLPGDTTYDYQEGTVLDDVLALLSAGVHSMRADDGRQILDWCCEFIKPFLGAPNRTKVVLLAQAAGSQTAPPPDGEHEAASSDRLSDSMQAVGAAGALLQQHGQLHHMFGNEDICTFFKLHHNLFERLSSAHRCCDRGGEHGFCQTSTAGPSAETQAQASAQAAGLWSKVSKKLQQHVGQVAEKEATSRFEECCESLLGSGGHCLFNLDWLVQKAVKLMAKMVLDKECTRLWHLLRQQGYSGHAGLQQYKAACRAISGNQKLFLLQYGGGPGRFLLTISSVSSKGHA